MSDKILEFGQKQAIVYDGITYTYSQLHDNIKELKGGILKCIKNKVVAILGDYSFLSIASFFALYENHNIIVPITNTVKEEVQSRLDEAFCEFSIAPDDGLRLVNLECNETHEMIEKLKRENHAGLVLFSSGSTGKPKAMVHDLDILMRRYDGKRQKSLNMLVFLMFDHIGGINTLLNILSIGSTAIIARNRDPDEICKLLQDHRIMILPSSPTFLNLILMSGAHKRYDLSALRMITYGTETMSESLLERLKTQFPKVKFLQTFGTSETGIASTSSKDSTFMKIDDKDLEYKIVDNELWLRSKTQIVGYLNAPMDSFTDDGWFKTGDLVQLGEDGGIKIIGRSKEVINVGGQKVLPSEVESVIFELDAVKDVMVSAEKSTIIGQMVVAKIVLNKEISKSEILRHCISKLDKFKVPAKIEFVDEIKFNPRFKKQRL